MKIYIMTDMEGVAGVVSSVDYCSPESRYYETGCELTTLETNAAIEGALEAGATDFLVVDGHGHGAITPGLLHPRARLMTGRPMGYPFGCDPTFDAAFIVGQHAKANTDGGHLSHTGSFNVEDVTINHRSLGELGINMLYIASFGVPTLLVTGDHACSEEATDLVPQIETATVKEGLRRGAPAGLTADQARRYNGAAIHLHPEAARERIRDAARRALQRRAEIPRFWIDPPYQLTRTYRASDSGATPAPTTRSAPDILTLLTSP